MGEQQVSVAIATFNGETYLQQQLDSIASQTRYPLEVVICDDGSTDGTLSLLQAFAADAPFQVRVINNPQRLGYSANFMKAVSLCQGSLIAFCDQDDIWEATKIEIVEAFFANSDFLVASHDFSVIFEDQRASIPSYFEHLERNGYSIAINIKGCTLVFRRELIDSIDWPPSMSGWSHDTWICAASTLVGIRGYIRNPLIRHRIHGANNSGRLVPSNSLLGRLVRRAELPLLTSRAEVDEFVSYFGSLNYGVLVDHISQGSGQFREDHRRRAMDCLAASSKVAEFVSGSCYTKPGTRIVGALRLLGSGSYRSSDGLRGFLLDLLGQRRKTVTQSNE